MLKCSVMLMFLPLVLSVPGLSSQFHVIKEWKYINFSWPNEESFRTAVAKGSYIPDNNVISGIKYYEDFYYLTLPRMRDGVPATVARIPANSGDTAPLLTPFPSWEMNNLDDCNAIQNVQNIEIDDKGQMWIIDGGHTSTLSEIPNNKCTPKLLIFDIQKHRITTSYLFPESVANKENSYLYDLVLDDSDGGYAYITDNSALDPGLVVFSFQLNQSWKIRHSKTMRGDPMAQQFRINDVMVNAPINIAGIALGPKISRNNFHVQVSEDRELYYSPISSLHLYSISTLVLKNETISKGHEYFGDVKDNGIKASQSDGMIMDNQGILYYGLIADNSIAKWDSRTPFASGQKIIARDANFIQWANTFAFDNSGNLTVVTNRLQKFIYGKYDLSEANFRILAAHVGANSYLHDLNKYEISSPMDPVSDPIPLTEAIPVPEPAPQPTLNSIMHSFDGNTTVKNISDHHGPHSHKLNDNKSSGSNYVACATVLSGALVFLVLR